MARFNGDITCICAILTDSVSVLSIVSSFVRYHCDAIPREGSWVNPLMGAPRLVPLSLQRASPLKTSLARPWLPVAVAVAVAVGPLAET